MSDYLDFMVILLPLFVGLTVFFIVGFLIRGKPAALENFTKFTRIFLSEGATLKTWGLFLTAFALVLVMSGVFAKIANDATWTRIPATEHDRIHFFLIVAVGLEVLLSIVLGSFGAVAFKGQGPGGLNFQLNQEPNGTVTTTASAPAPAPAATPTVSP